MKFLAKKCLRKALSLWEGLVLANKKKTNSFIGKIAFAVLVVAEFFYMVVFRLNQAWRKKRSVKTVKNCFVISVGNIAVGGTGKTLFCQFLAHDLVSPLAFICRGYGGSAIRRGNSLLVSDGLGPLVPASVCGDEAHMLARLTKNTVVVGSSRRKALLLLTKVSNLSMGSFVVLDDAYQNHELKKDCEILLLDARHPFENGHCFPAGKLREKDISRAHIIVLTHADKACSKGIQQLKDTIFSSKQVVVRGRHKVKKIVSGAGNPVDINALKIPLFAVAGIGSFGQFIQTVKEVSGSLAGYTQYSDHYNYTRDDYHNIINNAKTARSCGIVTTEKDWSKLKPFFEQLELQPAGIEWYIVQIEFEFLSLEEYSTFKEALRSRVTLN